MPAAPLGDQRVAALYDRDHCIGHAYFTPLAKVPDGDERLVALQQVWRGTLDQMAREGVAVDAGGAGTLVIGDVVAIGLQQFSISETQRAYVSR